MFAPSPLELTTSCSLTGILLDHGGSQIFDADHVYPSSIWGFTGKRGRTVIGTNLIYQRDLSVPPPFIVLAL